MTSDSPLRSVKIVAIHEMVVDEIRRAIEMWAFRPGDYLPSERDLTEILGVSRNTIRTAMAILEGQGLLRIKRGRGGGYIIQDPAFSNDRGDEIRRRPEVVLDAWDFRLTVDVGAASLAAERRNEEDLHLMSGLLGLLSEAHRDYEARETLDSARHCQALDSQFFLAIAHATRNQFIVDSVIEARRKLWIAFSSYLVRLDPNSEKRRIGIFQAIEKGDAYEAGQLMRRHLETGRHQFKEWLNKPLAPPLLPDNNPRASTVRTVQDR
jgi:DNA-binding FadR family transcriptional regulator